METKSRNINSKLNQEIEEEVTAFTARTSRQPTDDEFMVLENTVRGIRAKYVKNGGGGDGGGSRCGSSTGSRESCGGRRSCNATSAGRGGTPGSSKPGVSAGKQEKFLLRRSVGPCER